MSLYEKLGGEAAVNAAVDIFYRKVLTDDGISDFFDDVDMERQALKQKAFLTMVFIIIKYKSIQSVKPCYFLTAYLVEFHNLL